jgi:putative oxidoreductase
MASLDRFRDLGLLILRVGLGGAFMAHGWPKLAGGAHGWAQIGGAMKHVGITFAPTAFGFAAAISEFFGGLLFALGLLFRPACALLAGTMAMATTMHLSTGDGFTKSSHAIEAGIVFVAMLLVGPGKHALQNRLRGKA